MLTKSRRFDIILISTKERVTNMKTVKKIIISLVCVLFLVSAFTMFASAAKVTKAEPEVKSVTASSVKLVWDAVKGADGYRVYKVVDGKLKKITDTEKTAYTVKKLTASSTYKFAVRHYKLKNGKVSLSSNYGTVTAKTKSLSKVQGFTATQGDSISVLKWDKLAGASGYRLYIKNARGEWEKIATVNSTKTSYIVKKASAFDKLSFRIKPYAKATKGTVWGSATTCSAAVNPATAPEILDVIGEPTSLTINWEKVSGASGYRVYAYDDGKYSVIGRTYGEDNTSYTVTGLKSNTAYKFAIKAFKKADGKTSWGILGELCTAHTARADLDVYRAEQVSELLAGKEFYIEYSEDNATYGTVKSVMAYRMGKIYLKETVKGVSTVYLYNEATDNVYILDPANKKYRQAADSEEYDILISALHEHMKFEKMGDVTAEYLGIAGFNGPIICESFTEAKYGRYVELYFSGEDTLEGIFTRYADGKESHVNVQKLSETADASLFEIPLDYTLF